MLFNKRVHSFDGRQISLVLLGEFCLGHLIAIDGEAVLQLEMLAGFQEVLLLMRPRGAHQAHVEYSFTLNAGSVGRRRLSELGSAAPRHGRIGGLI